MTGGFCRKRHIGGSNGPKWSKDVQGKPMVHTTWAGRSADQERSTLLRSLEHTHCSLTQPQWHWFICCPRAMVIGPPLQLSQVLTWKLKVTSNHKAKC
jgi:hypothetical protein